MPNKLTDSEIVKALDICSTKGASCKDCPAFVKVDRSNCKKVLIGAKELINRLQADLVNKDKELLQALKNMAVHKTKVIDCEKEINYLQAENARLKAEAECADGYADALEEQAKAEAYKECIEKVKEEIAEALKSNYKAKNEHIEKHYQCLSCDFLATTRGKIDALSGLEYFLDNLLKELVGEDNTSLNNKNN